MTFVKLICNVFYHYTGVRCRGVITTSTHDFLHIHCKAFNVNILLTKHAQNVKISSHPVVVNHVNHGS